MRFSQSLTHTLVAVTIVFLLLALALPAANQMIGRAKATVEQINNTQTHKGEQLWITTQGENHR